MTNDEAAPAASVPAPVTNVSVAHMAPGGTNPRKSFDKVALDELTSSVREHGVLQPVLLRPWPAGKKPPKSTKGVDVGFLNYEIVAGERRWRAAQAAGLAEIPALVRELTDTQVLEIQVVENLQRTDLHPLEEADGYRRLVAAKYDVARIAERVGRSVAYIYDRLKLANLVDEARELFLAGKIQAGHAIVLARLKPEDQKRAIETDGVLFDDEHLLWDPEAPSTPEDESKKPRTVRELQAWIDEHVHFDELGPEADAMLFPDTVQAVTRAVEDAEKVVQITHESFVQPCAKDGDRIYGPQAWRRADPSCERQVTGVIVVGPGRGQAFPVCVDKKRCEVHWKDEIRARKRAEKAVTKSGKTGADKYELQRQKQERQYKREEAERQRWLKAVPEILEAIASAVKAVPATSAGPLGDVLVGIFDRLLERSKKAGAFVPRGKSAEDLVRHLAFLALCEQAGDQWSGPRNFPKRAKALGIDVAKILDQVAPAAPAGECRTCGCTEEKACKGGCGWTQTPDPKTGLGLCSACASKAAIAKTGKLVHALHSKPKARRGKAA